MSQTIKAMVDEFRKGDILKQPENFEEQVRHDVMMDLVPLVNKCSVHQLKAEAEKLLSAKQRSNGKTEDLYQDYLKASKSKYFNKHDLKEYLDEMTAPFYRPGTSGGSTRYLYEGTVCSSGIAPSTLHSEQMGTVEEAYGFRKRYLSLYIEILQDILQNT